MFNHPGRSLKTYGKIVFIVGVIVSIIGGILMFIAAGQASQSYYTRGSSGTFVFIGILVIALGIFFSYLLSIFTIAFGELVENSTIIRNQMENKHSTPSQPSYYTSPQPEPFTPAAAVPPVQPPVNPVQNTVNLNKASDILICPTCHTDNAKGAGFCRNCGTKLR